MKKIKAQISDILEIDILKAKLFFSKDAIIVYQMGKVGSTTVYTSLKKQLFLTPVFHVHSLSKTNLEKIELAYKKVGKITNRVRHLSQGNLISKKLSESTKIQWKIITLVREPIIREISIFFQQKDRTFPDGIETSKIIDILQNKFASFDESTDFACNWFDQELKSNFNINVYDFAFNQNAGYHIIESSNSPVLIIRLEDLNNCFKSALGK